MHKITTTIATTNNLPYLKLAIESVRKNAHDMNMPIIVFAENCTDGTDEWLKENSNNLDLEYYIEHNEIQKGIGGGIDFCVDLELLKLYDNIDDNTRLIASSFRIQPNIFPNDPPYRPGTVFYPVDDFGAYADDFKK